MIRNNKDETSKENEKFDTQRNKNFGLRPEQKDAVNKTSKYFKNYNFYKFATYFDNLSK